MTQPCHATATLNPPCLPAHPFAAGGGRMEHYASQGVVSIYGFSSAFGQAPHDVTAALLRRWLPRHDISVAYNGY